MKLLFMSLLVVSFNGLAANPAPGALPSPVECEKGYSVYRYVDKDTKNLVVACATSGTPRINHGPAVIYSPKGEVIRETTFVNGRENFILKDSSSTVHEGPKSDELKKEEHPKKK